MTTHAPASQGLAVEMTGLRRSYGDVHALDGLDLHIEPAEMRVLLGPSGCGKTTALRLLAGLERQDAGTISVTYVPSAFPVAVPAGMPSAVTAIVAPSIGAFVAGWS